MYYMIKVRLELVNPVRELAGQMIKPHRNTRTSEARIS